jgi:hypothetical protein
MRAAENDGRMESRGKPNQVSHGFPPALEIAGAIPTFPTARRLLDSFEKQKERSDPRLSPQIDSRLIFGLEHSFRPKPVRSKTAAR